MNEKRKVPEDIIEELEKMKDDIESMEFACAVMSRKIDDLINEYRRKEGNTPANLDRLYTLLNDQTYKLQELARNTWNAICAAEEEGYAVIKLKVMKSGKKWRLSMKER